MNPRTFSSKQLKFSCEILDAAIRLQRTESTAEEFGDTVLRLIASHDATLMELIDNGCTLENVTVSTESGIEHFVSGPNLRPSIWRLKPRKKCKPM